MHHLLETRRDPGAVSDKRPSGAPAATIDLMGDSQSGAMNCAAWTTRKRNERASSPRTNALSARCPWLMKSRRYFPFEHSCRLQLGAASDRKEDARSRVPPVVDVYARLPPVALHFDLTTETSPPHRGRILQGFSLDRRRGVAMATRK